MRIFIKIILSIILIAVTAANIVVFAYTKTIGDENTDKLIARTSEKVAEDWYNKQALPVERELHIDNNYSYEVKNIDKHIRNIEVVHVYNTNVVYYDKNSERTELKEITTYNLNGYIWCNDYYFPIDAANWNDLTKKYYDESKYGNGNINSCVDMECYKPLINQNKLYSKGTDLYFPLALLKKSYGESTRQVIQITNDVEVNVSNDYTKWSHWEHAHIAYNKSREITYDTLTYAKFTFIDGTTQSYDMSKDDYFTLREDYKKINLYKLSKIELHFDSRVTYYEREYEAGKEKAFARFDS